VSGLEVLLDEVRALRREQAELRRELLGNPVVRRPKVGWTAVDSAKALGVSVKTFHTKWKHRLEANAETGRYDPAQVEKLRGLMSKRRTKV